MPHKPGHNRPFTSFLTQGMQNTNQNINTMNRPGGQTNYLAPPNQFMGGSIGVNPGGGGYMGGGQQGGAQYDDPGGSTGGLDTQDEWDYMQQGYTDLPGGVGGFFGNRPQYDNPYVPDLHDPFDFQTISNQGGIGWKNIDPVGQEQGMPTEELPQGFQWQFINNEWIPVNIMTPGEVDLDEDYGGFSWSWQGPTESEDADYNYAPTAQDELYNLPTTLQNYAGGGGLAGSLAKKLYYPGTSGGFAGVGRGIKGGKSLQEMLGGM